MMDSSHSPSFGELLRIHRTKKGFTQQELADFSTISVRAIRDLEHGRVRHPRKVTARLLAQALRLDEHAGTELLEAAGRIAGHLSGVGGSATELSPSRRLPLLGRQEEAASLTLLLASPGSRLVTVTGAPGSGRSHFITEVAQCFRASSGVPMLWAWTEEPGTFGAGYEGRTENPACQVTKALYGESPLADGDIDSLRESMGDGPALLVLDRPRPGPLHTETLGRLLISYPGLRLLTVAPRPHSIPGERVFPLAPLASSVSVELIIRCMGEAWSPAIPDTEDTRDLAEICGLLDHLPGAVVRAATWLTLYDPPTLLECLRQDPVPFLRPLNGTDIDLGEALRAGAEPSNPHERIMLDLLSSTSEGERADGLARVSGLGLADCGRALNDLIVRGLVRCDRSTGRAKVHLLNLVRALRTFDDMPRGSDAVRTAA